jgi:hypothetical protein
MANKDLGRGCTTRKESSGDVFNWDAYLLDILSLFLVVDEVLASKGERIIVNR